LIPQQGAFSITIEPASVYSLTTTTGQGKGTATPPKPAPFPFPYADDFDEYHIGATPKYLSDQNGVFEIVECKGRSGSCLEQMIVRRPISWGMTPDPFTYAGDIGWRDYEVNSDILFNEKGDATVLGRIESADVFQGNKARWPSAYILTVNDAGEWELKSAKYKVATRKLASGRLSFDKMKWHRLSLRFRGTTIRAAIDGTVLATVTDSSHTKGMAGIGSGWNHVLFDNFSVQR
jgi:hypothetical protein